ncbi:MAG: FHA domain-containing protein [Gammaproteobacteria bacterium]
MSKLVLTHQGITLRSYPLAMNEIRIGHKAENDIQVDDAAVSGYHARIVRSQASYLDDHEDFFIEDLGSTNGTLINNASLSGQHLLKNGDVIRIGQHQFHYDTEQGVDLDTTAIYLPD